MQEIILPSKRENSISGSCCCNRMDVIIDRRLDWRSGESVTLQDTVNHCPQVQECGGGLEMTFFHVHGEAMVLEDEHRGAQIPLCLPDGRLDEDVVQVTLYAHRLRVEVRCYCC